MIYESTRDINRKLNPSEAILQGLSEEGGLFVLRDLGKNKLDLEKLIGKSYYEVAEAVLRLFVDFSDEEIKNCVEEAYRGKFSHENITPLVELEDGHILELFNIKNFQKISIFDYFYCFYNLFWCKIIVIKKIKVLFIKNTCIFTKNIVSYIQR